jgi:transposase InsO family protein
MPAVRASFVASARTYGARRIWRDVLEAGFSCGLHKIERLMRAQALRARPRRRALPKDEANVQPQQSRRMCSTATAERLVTRQASRCVGRAARPRRLNTTWDWRRILNETTYVLDAAAGRVKNVSDGWVARGGPLPHRPW